jgi:RHS repeat-associated protein
MPDGPTAIAALRDSAAETLVAISAELRYPRAWHSATMLPDGRVLILGGRGTDAKPVKAIEIFDPETMRFETLRSASLAPCSNHTATLLTEGRVLIAGGLDKQGRALDRLEIWDWENDVALRVPRKLARARYGHNAALQPDGSVMFSGGLGKSGAAIGDVEVYDSNGQRIITTEASGNFETARELRMEASLPENGALNVPVNKRIALRFSKPVRVDSTSAGSLVLSGPAGLETAKIVPAESGILVFVTSNKPLLGGSTYTLSLNGIVDPSGSTLSPTSITFTTASAALPEFTPSEGEDWTPDADNRDWRTGRAGSPWQSLPPLQAEPGVTAVAGQVLTLNGLPLTNVTLRIDDKAVRTDGTGRFLLTAIDAGHRELVIDGRTASKRRKTYGTFEAGADVKPNQTNALGYTIWMPRIDTAHEVTIPSPTNSEVVITTPYIPGLEVHIPPHTVITDIEGKPVTRLSITAIPVDRPPFPLPSGVYVPIYFTVQPGGAYVKNLSAYGSKGVRLIYPNYRHESPGARANFWHYDPQGKGWYVYGQGNVTADGTQVVPDPGISIYEFTGAMINVDGYVPPANGATPGGTTGGDPVDLSTGLFVLHSTDLAISDVMPISVSRTYNPGDSVSRQFGIGTSLDLDMYLWSANQYQETDLFLPDGGRIHYVRTSGGIGYLDAVFEHTATPTAFYKSTIVYGWTLKLKDGTKYLFGDTSPLHQIEDRYGNRIGLARGPNIATGHITRITSPNGRYIDLTYDTSNRVSQAVDNIGRTVTYTYDAGGRLWKVTNPNNGVTEYTYDASNRMLTIKDARGIVYLTNEYDANGRVTRQTQADQTTFQFAYTLDANNKVTQTDVTNPRGYVRRVTFNSSGYTLTETFALGTPEEQTYTYDRQAGTNLVQSVTDPLGRRADFTYDSKGNVATVTGLAGTAEAMTSSFTYEPEFNGLATATDPLNHTTTFGYDSVGSLTSVTDALNHQTTVAYNTAGQPITMTDALNHASQLTYLSGELSRVANPLGQGATRFADSVGRTMSMVNPLGQRVRYEYDVLSRVTRVTDPLQGVTQFSYDPNGNLLTVTDARNNSISYVYDNMDRVVTRGDQLLRETTYQYDANGNVHQVTDRKGQVTTYSYDALDRLTLVTYQDGSTTSFNYDAASRVTSTVDSLSGTITYGYDNLDRATSVTTPQGTVSYAYDAAGRCTSMNVAGQAAIIYTYDNANRLTQIAQGSATVSFVYDAANRLTSQTMPNGVVSEYSYDDASRLSGITYKKGGVTLGDLTYEYDAAGHRTKVGGNFARTGVPPVLNTASYDVANKQTAFASQSLSYDNNGNLTSDGVNSYLWNARNQLTGMSGPGLNASFGYDALGRRVSKTVNSASTSYLYDGGNIIQEQSGGSPSANTLTGGVDQFFSRSDGSGTVSPLRDSLGSSIALADSTGAVQTQYSYEPFGKTTATGAASNNSQKYTGREDDGTGLYYYRARYYSPTLHRFIREDPIGLAGGINLYSYVENDPVSFRDPWGLDKRGGSSWSDKWFELADIRSAQEWWRKFHDEQIKEGNWALASLADLEDGLLDYSGLNTVQESSEVLGSDASTGEKLWAGTKIAGVAVSWYLAGTTQITGRIAGQTRTSRIIGLRNKFGQHWYTDENGFFFALDSKFHRLHIGQWKGWFK